MQSSQLSPVSASDTQTFTPGPGAASEMAASRGPAAVSLWEERAPHTPPPTSCTQRLPSSSESLPQGSPHTWASAWGRGQHMLYHEHSPSSWLC